MQRQYFTFWQVRLPLPGQFSLSICIKVQQVVLTFTQMHCFNFSTLSSVWQGNWSSWFVFGVASVLRDFEFYGGFDSKKCIDDSSGQLSVKYILEIFDSVYNRSVSWTLKCLMFISSVPKKRQHLCVVALVKIFKKKSMCESVIICMAYDYSY